MDARRGLIPTAMGSSPAKASFFNRELSWLAFNRRILAEAEDPEVPLLERLKFLSILSANLDEFFMIRVAGLLRQVLSGDHEPGADGLSPQAQREAISREVHGIVDDSMRLFRGEIGPALAREGVGILRWEDLDEEARRDVEVLFRRDVLPVLTPLAVDTGHPFPHLFNKTMNLAVVLDGGDDQDLLGVVQVPRAYDRLVPLPAPEGERRFLLLESLIRRHLAELFPGHAVKGAHLFRVTRDADLALDEEDDPLLFAVERQLRRREWGIAARLEIEGGMPASVEAFIRPSVAVEDLDVYRVDGPLQFSDFMALASLSHRPDLRDPPLAPVVRGVLRHEEDVFAAVARGDILLHHPYESFESVVRFLRAAAEDPDVLAVKQTLYRTSGDSPVADALAKAAENGKQVAALVELRARFDEGSNILWARALERAGAHVVYGVVGLKIGCKMTLVVRRERGGLRRYAHLSTGDYNPETASVYTDLGMLTADPDLTSDVSDLFNALTGNARPPRWRMVAVSPFGLKDRLLDLIAGEREEARGGRPSRILCKLNALVDREVIAALYGASRSGVPVDLVVRGICCLRPGVPGLSETIRVRSVVDRFLEHERVFAFGAGGRTRVFLSSADWMPRNFLRRVEVLWPVNDPSLSARLQEECLGASLADNRKAWELLPDGTSRRVAAEAGAAVRRSQTALLDAAEWGDADASPPSRPIRTSPRRSPPSADPRG